MTMTLTCNGDCNHQQQSQCNAHTAMTMAMTCNGDYNHTAMTMTIKTMSSRSQRFAKMCLLQYIWMPETFDASAILTYLLTYLPQ